MPNGWDNNYNGGKEQGWQVWLLIGGTILYFIIEHLA